MRSDWRKKIEKQEDNGGEASSFHFKTKIIELGMKEKMLKNKLSSHTHTHTNVYVRSMHFFLDYRSMHIH